MLAHSDVLMRPFLFSENKQIIFSEGDTPVIASNSASPDFQVNHSPLQEEKVQFLVQHIETEQPIMLPSIQWCPTLLIYV